MYPVSHTYLSPAVRRASALFPARHMATSLQCMRRAARMDSTPPAATMLVSRPSSVARRSMLYLSCSGVFGAYIGCIWGVYEVIRGVLGVHMVCINV